MPDTQRDKFVKQIQQTEKALATTKSPYLKRDYEKLLKRMRAELKQYDLWHKKAG